MKISERLYWPTDHPGNHDLTAFARGYPLDDDQTQAIAAHVTTCVDCQRLMADIHPDGFMEALTASPAGSDELQTDRRLVEGYELISLLGSGGAGIVYRARQPGLGREVALKVLRGGSTASNAELYRWRREIRTLAALDHPHIVKLYDAGEQAGTPFLAMELVEGTTLSQLLAAGPLESVDAAALVRDLADAMDYAHQQSIIHRDLKPSNILIPSGGPLAGDASPRGHSLLAAKIADFGLSRWLLEEGQTCTGDPLGTPSYMAPEQIRGAAGQLGPSTDVYGLGCVLYECLTGRPAFRGATSIETMQLVLQRDPPPIARQRSAVPRDLDAICTRCMEKDPSRRYATAAGLRDDLQRFLEGRPVVARKPGPMRLARLWVSRNPWLASFVGLLLVAVIGGSSALLWHNHQLSQQRALAHRQYAQARATIRKMLDAANSNSALTIPKLGEMTLQQSREALELFERLAAEEHTESSLMELARVRLDLGTLLVAQGDSARGEQQLRLAADEFRQLRTLTPDSQDLISSALAAQVKLSVALTSQQRFEESLAVLAPARQLGEQLLAINPENIYWLSNLAWVHHSNANNLLMQGNVPEAVAENQQSVVLLQQALSLDPTNQELAQSLTETQINLAQCRLHVGDFEQAREEFIKAIDSIDATIDAGGEATSLWTSRAVACLNLSNVIAQLEGPEAAIRWCDDGIGSAEAVYRVEPNHAGANDALFRLLGNRAMYRMTGDQVSSSIVDWRRAIELAPEAELRTYCQTMLIRAHAMIGQSQEAAQLAESCQRQSLSRDNRFRLASSWGALAEATRSSDRAAASHYGLKSFELVYQVAQEPNWSSDTERQQLFHSSDDFRGARQWLAAQSIIYK